MFRINRHQVGSLLAASLLAMLCASVAGTAVADGRPAGAPGSIFGAVTSQGNPVLFKVTTNRRLITRLLITVEEKCQSGETLVVSAGGNAAVAISGKGTFSASASRGPTTLPDGRTSAFSDQVSGKFNKARTQITGTWHNLTTITNPATGMSDTCDSGTVSFTAVD
jgi:hypothetical protein